ncbi:hypothetical protein EMPG_15991 [Blastomyces silverae]|uniref:Cytochrome b561 domain-containing protein n=1 Tax=Blastomyces silverae TaxID=2060906 RepID=A0A0H1BBR5_9EURO|nr:hypothetical protein EMPG_15991 [Blastomyces silverae]
MHLLEWFLTRPFDTASLPTRVSGKVMLQDLRLVPQFAKAHGVVMSIAFVIIFPLGALFVRTQKIKGGVWIHAACQLIGWILTIAGLATGIRVGKILDRLHNNAHTILGTAIIALLLLQPLIGFVHHRKFMMTQRPGPWTRFHVWYGRVLILLGMTNGGLGLQLADNTRAGTVAYGVVAGLVGVAYCTVVAFFEVRKWSHRDDVASDVGLEERSKSPTP